MSFRYFWISTTGGNWIPEDGVGYYYQATALSAANSYFNTIGISGVSLTATGYWEVSSGFADGIKYYIPLVSGYVVTGEGDLGCSDVVGYCFRFDYNPTDIKIVNNSEYIRMVGKGGGTWASTTISG
jgi:hypothetical protein